MNTSNTSSTQTIQTLASTIVNDINKYFVPVLFALMFITFLWGVYQYFIAGAANEEKQKQGRQFVMWSVIGFVIIFSLWGIVNLITNSLQLNNTQPTIPTLQTNLNSTSNSTNPVTSPATNPVTNPGNGLPGNY